MSGRASYRMIFSAASRWTNGSSLAAIKHVIGRIVKARDLDAPAKELEIACGANLRVGAPSRNEPRESGTGEPLSINHSGGALRILFEQVPYGD